MYQLKLVHLRAPVWRFLLVLPVALSFFIAWSAARWYMGNEIASVAARMPEGAIETAQSATRLAPDDPLTHWSLAALEQRGVSSEQVAAAVSAYERAVSLSPHDFRLWVDLGRAREQAGDARGSEQALRRAIELAPAYVWPRWHLGNFLVRQGRNDEGFNELRRVAESDNTKRGAVFDLAWNVYGGDVEMMRRAAAESPTVRVDFLSYLLTRRRVDEAYKLWSGFSAAEKREQAAVGQTLVNYLVEEKRFRAAAEVAREAIASGQEGGAVLITPGKITNGDFESAVAQSGASAFDWRVTNVQQAQIALDPARPHGGQRSLFVRFNATGALTFENVTQTIAVEPGAQYRLTFYVRTNELKTASAPIVQVLNASNGRLLAASQPAPAGQSDWQEVAVDFKLPPDSDGITLRMSRAACTAENGVCPIFGTVWYDDFNLQLVG